ncbi:MAG TPA: asparagine synthase-related protein [Candidatus Saccharimonadales bacterium]|nr:asparagine synthase-related protein [Candidatus Saccharimonadales bacterium]
MSVGFFVTVSAANFTGERYESAFISHTPWALDGGNRQIELRGRNFQVTCIGDNVSGTSSLWKETDQPEFRGSFVYILGWCYRISTSSACLCAADYREMIQRLYSDVPPLNSDFGGHYVAVIYDSKRQRLAIQPDRLAIGASFFAEANGEFAASNRALRLANYFGASLDGQSILAQMRGTHIPFGRTLFTGVRRLMGSTYLEFDLAAGRAVVKKPYSAYVPTQKISYADSVDLVTDKLKTTVSRLLAASPVRFDLTGGNDTRAIASAVESITRGGGHHEFGFRVADPEGSPDVIVARRVAESCGWPLTRVDRFPSEQASLEEISRAATCGDGNFPVHHIWDRVHSERVYARQYQWKTHVGAPAGELFRGYFYAQEMMSIGRTSKVNYDALLAYRTYASRGVDLRIFGGDAQTFEAHDQAMIAPYRAIGEEGGSLPNTHKLDLMYLQRHCYRAGNTLASLSGFLNACAPFLSWELAGVGLSLPWKYRANRGLMQRVIGRLSPKLANIPSEDGEPMKPLSLATLPAYVASQIPMRVDHAGRVIRRLLGRSGGVQKNRMPEPLPIYFDVLDKAKMISGIFDPTTIRQVRAQAGSEHNSVDSSTMFYVLCTVELLLREAPAIRPQVVFN